MITKQTDTRLTALFLGLLRWAGTRKLKPIWILLKQETVSGSGISWAYASLHLAPDRQPHQHPTTLMFFYRPDALPAAQPTVSKHWRQVDLYSGHKTAVVVVLHMSMFVLWCSMIACVCVLQAELKELTGDQYSLLSDRRAHCEQLRSAREEKRKQVVVCYRNV